MPVVTLCDFCYAFLTFEEAFITAVCSRICDTNVEHQT